MPKTAGIILVGNEILSGKIIDANAAYLCRELRELGVDVLPGVPEIFRRKFDAMRERFRDAPIHLKNVFVRIGEGTLAAYLNRLLDDFPLLLVGSYPELSNPEYQVKVTLESRDRGYLEQALADFIGRLPGDALVKVT